MNIGKKIKELRSAKFMSQAELAGDQITRNMLSYIENGAANPSLSTIVYLASRLGVPAGFLLADDADEFIYKKMDSMRNIKVAYKEKNYELCRDICLSSFGSDSDDEIELILADCCINLSEECLEGGRLHRSRNYLDEAILHSEKTIYKTDEIIARATIIGNFLGDISLTLDMYDSCDGGGDERYYSHLASVSRLCRYIMLLDKISNEEECQLLDYTLGKEQAEDMYLRHLTARDLIAHGNFNSALELLFHIVKTDMATPKILLYLACGDIEICSREIGDYRSAYEFSQSKLSLLESMLAEEF